MASTSADDYLDQFLIRRILLIDSDEHAVQQITGILAHFRGAASGETIEDAAVSTLDDAHRAIETHKPYTILLDPAIDSLDTVLGFMEAWRTRQPHLIWVIHTRDNWWRENETRLANHEYGHRLLTYYRLSKNLPPQQLRSRFVQTLAQCEADFVLELFRETTEEISDEMVGQLTKDQVIKFVRKALQYVRSLIAATSRPEKGDSAFVSMRFTDQQRDTYRLVIQRVVQDAGLVPIMMADEYPDHSLSSAIIEGITSCKLFIADTTGLRPDVMIEIGLALMLSKPMILIADHREIDSKALPLLLRDLRVEFYSSDADLLDKLKKAITSVTR